VDGHICPVDLAGEGVYDICALQEEVYLDLTSGCGY
jgi:hypothetical protein